jgi:hypothetical protein
MLRIRTTALSIFALTALLLPATTFASTKCLCNNGVITESMDDDSGACDDACDGMGGGRQWTEEDAGYTDEGVVTDQTPRERVRDRAEEPPAERR